MTEPTSCGACDRGTPHAHVVADAPGPGYDPPPMTVDHQTEPTSSSVSTEDVSLRQSFRSTDPEAVALWNSICDKADNDAERARLMLRGLGVKLAHPDDGWVKREPDGSGRFSRSWYPLFDDQPQVGDLMAFGSPYAVEHAVIETDPPRAAQGYRLVKVTKANRRVSILGYLQDFEFEPTGMTWPPEEPPRRRWWQRLYTPGSPAS